MEIINADKELEVVDLDGVEFELVSSDSKRKIGIRIENTESWTISWYVKGIADNLLAISFVEHHTKSKFGKEISDLKGSCIKLEERNDTRMAWALEERVANFFKDIDFEHNITPYIVVVDFFQEFINNPNYVFDSFYDICEYEENDIIEFLKDSVTDFDKSEKWTD